MARLIDTRERRAMRKRRVRKKIFGTAERPRVSVYKSNRHIYVQVIDDSRHRTLTSEFSQSGSSASRSSPNIDTARAVGEAIGKKIRDLKISAVIYDTNGNRYHGVIKTIADCIRESGVQI